MKIAEAAVTYGRKFNLGDYNQMHVEVTLNAVFEEGDVIEEELDLLRSVAREQVKAEYMRVVRQETQTPTDRVVPNNEGLNL